MLVSANPDRKYAKRDKFNYQVEFEDHYLNKESPFKIYQNWHNPEHTTKLHFHNCIEIGLCHKGTGVNVISNQIIPFNAGDVCIIPRGVCHWQLTNKGVDSIWTYVFFNPESIIPKLSGFQDQITGLFKKILVFDEVSVPGFRELFFDLIHEVEEGRAGYQEVGMTHIFILFVKILRLESLKLYNGPIDEMEQGGIERILPALNHIRTNYQGHIKNQDLAERCNMSPRNFSRLFKTTMQTTPKAYILQIRISISCFDLKNTRLPITEIAYKNGFQNISHFERAFKRLKGVSPRRFRFRNK